MFHGMGIGNSNDKVFLKISNQQRIINKQVKQISTINQQLSETVLMSKQLEEALNTSKESFRKVFEDGQLGLVLVDNDLNPIKANDNFFQLVGISPKEKLDSNKLGDRKFKRHNESILPLQRKNFN